jgi:hypothetical protein
MATLFGGLDKPGPYVVLMKWYPGYMSAPHSYVSDRLCLVLSGADSGGSRPRIRDDLAHHSDLISLGAPR